jgi:membrane protein DedA with SNARE-associated domain
MLRELSKLLGAPMGPHAGPAIAIAIFLGTFVSEDAATLSTSALVQVGRLDPLLGIISCFAGIWLGDIGIFAAARTARESRPCRSLLAGRLQTSGKAQAWVAERGWMAVLLSRFIPGTRVATSVAAGALRMPAGHFALVTGVAALGWVSSAAFLWPRYAVRLPATGRHWILGVGLASCLAGWILPKGIPQRLVKSLADSLRKYRHWEFWPAWLFYLPVVVYIVRLSFRHHSLRAPLFANPGIRTSGLVGESKIEILRPLMASKPDYVADGYLIDRGDPELRLRQAHETLTEHAISFPFVLKPDVGERGSGFRLVREEAQLRDYLSQVPGPVILQRYAPGPYEAGIFYYRLPHQPEGQIFSITDKVFPFVTGDGVRTLQQLIREDRRARHRADVYVARFHSQKKRIVAAGECIKLVEAGNHAQGCIFREGSHLYSEKLRQRIDDLSRAVPGFNIGRFDLRYSSTDDLREGRNFTVIELNGVASEATNIYDERNSLGSAYRTLFAQWRLIFEIGVSNQRRLIHGTESWVGVLQQWRIARRDAPARLLAD